LVILAIASCGSNSATTGNASGSASASNPISDEWQADSVASSINSLCGSIDYPTTSKTTKASSFDATYTDYEVSGYTGTANINGDYERDYSSSSSSVSDVKTLDVTLELSNFSSDEDGCTVTGTLDFYVYSSSYTYGATGYSSSFSKSITGNNLAIECPDSDSDGTIVDNVDVSISDKDGNQYSIEGSITNADGDTFYF
jgi:hypothetical protein